MNNSAAHTQLCSDILFHVGKLIGDRGRIFQRHVGLAVPIGREHPITFGIEGEADIQGWVKVLFWRNGLGPQSYAAMFAVEVKTGKATLSKAQRCWRDMFISTGGLYILGRDVDSALTSVKTLLL